MLAEYALIPDIFDSRSYASPGECDARLQSLKKPLLEEAIVRDLCNGGWREYLNNASAIWHLRSKELIKKLVTQNRLRYYPSAKISVPQGYTEWYEEALASHVKEPLTGIITTHSTAQCFKKKDPIIATIQKLDKALWWQSRSSSIRPQRNIEDYLKNLQKILTHSNSIMFIDPHLDPTKLQYKEFIRILSAIRRNRPPLIEIHRVGYIGTGKNRQPLLSSDLKEHFFNELHTPLVEMGLSVTIFIWDDFHDRFLITDIMGISLSNGFDTNRYKNDITTWTRIGREDRDNIQREFDPASNRHKLQHKFQIGTGAKIDG